MTEHLPASVPVRKPEYLEAVERLTATLRNAVAGHHDSILWWYDDLDPVEVNRVTASDARQVMEAVLSAFK